MLLAIFILRKFGAFDPQRRQRLTFSLNEICLEGTLSHALSLSMNADESSLGRCPECGEDISEAWILVEYKKNDGTEGVWAECPACGEVVAPK